MTDTVEQPEIFIRDINRVLKNKGEVFVSYEYMVSILGVADNFFNKSVGITLGKKRLSRMLGIPITQIHVKETDWRFHCRLFTG